MSFTPVLGFFCLPCFSSFLIVMLVVRFFIIDLSPRLFGSSFNVSRYHIIATIHDDLQHGWCCSIGLTLFLTYIRTWPCPHTCHLMILLRHRIFPGQREWSQPLQPSIPYSSRSWAILWSTRPDELWIVERTLDGIETWKTSGKHFWRTCTSPTIVLPYVPRLTIGADNCYDVPIQSSSSYFYGNCCSCSPTPWNIPTSMSPNRTKRYRTNSISYSHAGDVSAQHHSQGTTTSLFWPPWRSTPPSSPPANMATYLTSQSPYRPSSTSTWSTGCERYGPDGYVWLQCVIPHYLSASKKNSDYTSICDYSLGTPFPSIFQFLGFIPWSLSFYVAAWAFRFILK